MAKKLSLKDRYTLLEARLEAVSRELQVAEERNTSLEKQVRGAIVISPDSIINGLRIPNNVTNVLRIQQAVQELMDEFNFTNP